MGLIFFSSDKSNSNSASGEGNTRLHFVSAYASDRVALPIVECGFLFNLVILSAAVIAFFDHCFSTKNRWNDAS